MPQFTPKTISDPSNLSHGRHPGYLLAITEEAIPDGWEMGKKDTLMFRWHLCVWEHESHMAQYAPEQQSAISSRAFSPKGKYQQSKAYAWASALLGREIPKGQGVNLDPMLPLACLVDVERTPGNDYCKITAIWGRYESQGAIPPVVHQLRAQYVTGFPQGQPNGQGPPPQPQAPPPQAPQPYHTPLAGQTAAQSAPQPQAPGPLPHPDTLCQHHALPGHPAQPSGLCGAVAVTLLAGHRVCAAHKAQIDARLTTQPAQPPVPSTTPRGADAGGIPF